MSIQITEANLQQAIFMDDDRALMQVICLGEDGQNHTLTVRTDPEDHLFQQLMLTTSIDQIEEWSVDFYARQQEDIENYQKRLIDEGAVSYIRATGPEDNARIMSEIATMLFQYDETNMDQVEKLFNLKLEMFELEAVENATDAERESLREAADPMTAINILHGIMQ
jgi:hypothetical protein